MADGRVYVYADLKYTVPLATRKLTEKRLDAQGVSGPLRAAVVKAATEVKDVGKDALYCFDAADGRTLWCRQYDNIGGYGAHYNSSSSSPCIAQGRCYFAGADGALYCLNARDGSEIWAVHPASGLQYSSPLVSDSLVINLSIPSSTTEPCASAWRTAKSPGSSTWATARSPRRCWPTGKSTT